MLSVGDDFYALGFILNLFVDLFFGAWPFCLFNFVLDDGKSTQIYDGRRSHDELTKIDSKPAFVEKAQQNENSGRGEIIYFRDSDDEMPDSDEDPDDDLDI